MAHFSGKLPAQISSPSQLPSIMTRNKSTAPRVKEKQENKERRRVANRRSAQKSRFREMVVMEELQKSVDELSKQNEALRVENINFRREMAKLQGDPGIDTFRLDEISQHGRKRAMKEDHENISQSLFEVFIASQRGALNAQLLTKRTYSYQFQFPRSYFLLVAFLKN